MQGLFKNNAGHFLRLILLSVISVVLIYVDYRNDTLSVFRSALGTTIVEPVKFVATLPSNFIRSIQSLSTSRSILQTENERLRNEKQNLEAKLLRLDGLQAENQRLRDLLNSTENLQLESTIAEIIAIDLDPFKQVITLNKGSRDGVQISQAIIDAFGVMGQIINTTANTASILLISDPSHSLPVEIQRNGLRTLVNGTGTADELELMHIPTNADIQVGDVVITSGFGGIFPKNYPVGTIIDIQTETGQHFMQVKAKPAAQLNRSREVLILNLDKTAS